MWEEEMSMLGWGMLDNRITGAETPLFVRAAVLESEGGKLAYACLDLCFVSSALHRAVVSALEEDYPALGFGLQNVMLTATHTHSGPSGFSQYAMFNATNFGFSPKVFTHLADACLEAFVEAEGRLEAATLRLGRAMIPEDENFAFNRSLSAYLQNPESRSPLQRPAIRSLPPRSEGHSRPICDTSEEESRQSPPSQTRLSLPKAVKGRLTAKEAIERETVALRVEDRQGRTFGLLHWSAVHCTSVHADNQRLHADNKGEAARIFEEEFGKEPGFRPDLVTIFAQTTPGDLQPNFRWSRERRRLIGSAEDDFQSAREHGRLQARVAYRAWADAEGSEGLRGPIQSQLRYADLGRQEISLEGSGGRKVRTYPARLGLRQAAGTEEGPGPLLWARPWLGGASRLLSWLSPQGDPKLSFLEIGRGLEGRFLGLLPTRWSLPIVAAFEPMVAFLHGAAKAGYVGPEPWVPNVLPLQIVRIGTLWLVGLPTEPTLTAGRRLQAGLRQGIPAGEVSCLLIQGYSNAYAGYVATREEYRRQSYEGATTYFGPWTLAAYQGLLSQMLSQRTWAEDPRQRFEGPSPDPFEPERLLHQRLAGRQNVRGSGTSARIEPPAHLRHLERFSPGLQERGWSHLSQKG